MKDLGGQKNGWGTLLSYIFLTLFNNKILIFIVINFIHFVIEFIQDKTHFYCIKPTLRSLKFEIPIAVLFLNKDIQSFILICYTIWFIEQKIVKSACGIEAVYMCFNETGIWGGGTWYT